MDYRAMCIQQGYVPPTCQMDGQLCWLRVQEGKDPCEGCNYNRAKCNGRHTPYESDSYKLGVFVDAVLEAQRKREYELKLAEDRQIADRQQIQIDSNGYGKGIFEAIESLNLDIDIVPIIYQRMHLDY